MDICDWRKSCDNTTDICDWMKIIMTISVIGGKQTVTNFVIGEEL